MAHPKTRFKDAFARARAMGYRSGLEERTAKDLIKRGCTDFEYETVKVPYEVPARPAKYTPDFILPNGIVVETKGRWVSEDRKKLKLIMEQHPDLDLRIVFSRSLTPINKTSKTTYGMIATKLGIPYADKLIPQEWLEEPPNEASLEALKRISAS